MPNFTGHAEKFVLPKNLQFRHRRDAEAIFDNVQLLLVGLSVVCLFFPLPRGGCVFVSLQKRKGVFQRVGTS